MSEPSEERVVMDDYRAQGDTLIRLIRHGVEALRDGDGDVMTARVTLANLDQLTARYRGAVEALQKIGQHPIQQQSDPDWRASMAREWLAAHGHDLLGGR